MVDSAEVARILGISRQRVAQLVSDSADFPSAQAVLGGGRLWDRNAVEVWAVSHRDRGPRYKAPSSPPRGKMRHSLWQISKLATDEARYLHHDWVGSDHLLLAVMHPECPGAARKVLASFDVNLQEARNALVESLGDVFEESPHGWVTMPPATQLIFERATLKAFELRDENVTSQHVLLALIDDWSKSGTPACLAHVDCGADALRQRVIAMTEEMGDDQEPPSPPEPPPTAEPQMPRSPEPDLAMTPSGHDPRRRRPWGSAVFHDAEGRPLQQGTALRQYFIDRDGNPVLTADGRPVHLMIDGDGRYVLDEVGQPIVVPVDIPPGSTTKRTARQ